jgi:hypothetical protein
VAARKGEQGKGLIVEIEARIADLALEVDHGRHRRIGADEMLVEVVECVLHGLAPRAVPAEPAGLAIGEGLARDDTRPVRPRQRRAVEPNRFVETAPDAIRAVFPPQRQRVVEQPAPLRRRLAHEVAHAAGATDGAGAVAVRG